MALLSLPLDSMALKVFSNQRDFMIPIRRHLMYWNQKRATKTSTPAPSHTFSLLPRSKFHDAIPRHKPLLNQWKIIPSHFFTPVPFLRLSCSWHQWVDMILLWSQGHPDLRELAKPGIRDHPCQQQPTSSLHEI